MSIDIPWNLWVRRGPDHIITFLTVISLTERQDQFLFVLSTNFTSFCISLAWWQSTGVLTCIKFDILRLCSNRSLSSLGNSLLFCVRLLFWICFKYWSSNTCQSIPFVWTWRWVSILAFRRAFNSWAI